MIVASVLHSRTCQKYLSSRTQNNLACQLPSSLSSWNSTQQGAMRCSRRLWRAGSSLRCAPSQLSYEHLRPLEIFARAGSRRSRNTATIGLNEEHKSVKQDRTPLDTGITVKNSLTGKDSPLILRNRERFLTW